MLNLNDIIEASMSVNSNEMSELIAKVIELIGKERKGELKDAEVSGDLVTLKRKGKLFVVGDIHGDLASLAYIIKSCSNELRNNARLLFLGDYGDRGAYSAEVYYTLLRLKLALPDKVILMRGNHECPNELPFYPYDLPHQLISKFGFKGNHVHDMLKILFNQLYVATLVENSYLLIHGGAPTRLINLNEIAYAKNSFPASSTFEELLWNDPREIDNFTPSMRGYGFYFGEKITKNALKITNTKTLIRAHEPCDGANVMHNGSLITVFSCKGIYMNVEAAYLRINLEDEPLNAFKLKDDAAYF